MKVEKFPLPYWSENLFTPLPTGNTLKNLKWLLLPFVIHCSHVKVHVAEDRLCPGTHTAQVHRSSKTFASFELGDLVLVLTKFYFLNPFVSL